jgi:AraC-like DNA-binding protein
MRQPHHAALVANTLKLSDGGWTQRVGVYAGLPPLIRQLGADPVPLMRAAGLASDALDRPDGRVPYARIGRLLHLAAERTGCGHIGLLVGRMCHLADLGLVGEVVRHSPTVGDALRTLTVYQHLNSGGGLAFLIERPAVVEIGYAIYHPRVDGASHIYDAVLAAGANFVRELCGTSWMPSEVLLPHVAPANVAPWRTFFRLRPQFDAEIGALRFSAAWMQTPVVGADAERFRRAKRLAEAAGRGELKQRVVRALRVLMLSGDVSGEGTARMLSMHRRTLNRRLQDQGTTFQAVLDQVRFETARQLLESTSLPLDDVAAALGYASVSPFMRSFRRWTGTTPGRWRSGAERIVPDEQALAG